MQLFAIDCHRDKLRNNQCVSVPGLEQREMAVVSNGMLRFELAGNGDPIFHMNQ